MGDHAASPSPEPPPTSSRGIAASQGAARPKDRPSPGSLTRETLCKPAFSRELARASQPTPSSRLVKMSATAEVGLAKEASRQILAGGSAGKAAPSRRGPVAFPFACTEKRFSDRALNLSFAFILQIPRCGTRGAREQKRPGAGGGQRGALGQVPEASASAALGFPAFSVPSLKGR